MAHPDLDELLNAVLPFARQMLEKHGEFYPFGASLSMEGQTTLAAAYDGNERPPSQELIDTLREGFAKDSSSKSLKACAICFDCRVAPPGSSSKTDAIAVELEHSSGEAVAVYMPYAKGLFGKIKYGELFASPGERRVFRDS